MHQKIERFNCLNKQKNTENKIMNITKGESVPAYGSRSKARKKKDEILNEKGHNKNKLSNRIVEDLLAKI